MLFLTFQLFLANIKDFQIALVCCRLTKFPDICQSRVCVGSSGLSKGQSSLLPKERALFLSNRPVFSFPSRLWTGEDLQHPVEREGACTLALFPCRLPPLGAHQRQWQQRSFCRCSLRAEESPSSLQCWEFLSEMVLNPVKSFPCIY